MRPSTQPPKSRGRAATAQTTRINASKCKQERINAGARHILGADRDDRERRQQRQSDREPCPILAPKYNLASLRIYHC
jgi:hypothetical protein